MELKYTIPKYIAKVKMSSKKRILVEGKDDKSHIKNLLDEILPKAFTNFEIGVSDRITEIEEKADFERQGEVIALMMYLGDPPKLNEHLLVKNKSKCLEMKQIAEETSFAYYECAVVDANLRGGKITSINEELEVF